MSCRLHGIELICSLNFSSWQLSTWVSSAKVYTGKFPWWNVRRATGTCIDQRFYTSTLYFIVVDFETMAVARHREYSFPESLASTSDFYFELDTLVSPSEDFYDSVSPSENIWKKFELLPTPPLSPQREDEDDDCAFTSKSLKKDDEWLTTAIFDTKSLPTGGLKSKLIQDCMWSGSDEEQARSHRSRKVSLSELTMITTSTSCVDPTTFTAYPRQQNQVEHSYSLTTPEPMRVPPMYTPAQTDEDSG